ncbi:PLDc N-terminal domain-containing protein [Kribbella sp. NPDC051586]|uniref:PLDc N-terminal domain-containing protein n=1 Tax=Kribbella sp. NPDC051586 TaxID=3364118 RepID=UPI00379B0583
MSFWDIVWFIIISFAFVAYLMMLFSIITDLFRDSETSGWVKAIWLVALFIFPFLTAVVYVIARGRGMAERTATGRAAAQRQQEDYIKQVAGSTSPTDQIAQASSLLDKGKISQAEFDALKAKALAA